MMYVLRIIYDNAVTFGRFIKQGHDCRQIYERIYFFSSILSILELAKIQRAGVTRARASSVSYS